MEQYEGEAYEGFELNNYSVDKTYMRATNKFGVGQNQRTTFPAAVLAQAASVVQSKATPYRSIADLVRDGLYHRIAHWQNKNYEDLPDHGAMRLVAAEEEAATIAQWETLLELRKDTMNRASSAHKKRLYDEIMQDLEAVPPYLTDIIEGLRKLLP